MNAYPYFINSKLSINLVVRPFANVGIYTNSPCNNLAFIIRNNYVGLINIKWLYPSNMPPENTKPMMPQIK